MSADVVDLVLRQASTLSGGGRRWLAVDDGRVRAIEPETVTEPSARSTVDLDGALVVPGFVSAHHHSMDRAGRGLDPGRSFPDWLLGVYYRTALDLDLGAAHLAARHTASEAVRTGITKVVDCWGVGDVGSARAHEAAAATIEAYRQVGIRVVLAVMVGDVEPTWLARSPAERATTARMVSSTDSALAFVQQLVDGYHDPSAGVEVWPAPELPEMASDELWGGCLGIARAHDLRISTHLNASEPGAWTGPDRRERTVDRLDRLGVLDRLVGAHGSHLDDADIGRLAARGTRVVHCPSASLALASPPTPLRSLLDAGVRCGLGLDNPSLTATADLFAEARLAAGLVRLAGADQGALSVEHAFDLALGSLAPGAAADLVVIDTHADHWWPTLPPGAALAHQATVGDVIEVYVGGRSVWRRR